MTPLHCSRRSISLFCGNTSSVSVQGKWLPQMIVINNQEVVWHCQQRRRCWVEWVTLYTCRRLPGSRLARTAWLGGFAVLTSSGMMLDANSSGSLPLAAKVSLAFFMSLLAFAIMLGNAVVILAFVVDKNLRHRSNYFFLNLAISDFFVGKLCVFISNNLFKLSFISKTLNSCYFGDCMDWSGPRRKAKVLDICKGYLCHFKGNSVHMANGGSFIWK